MSVVEIQVGNARLTRVGYADVTIPPERAGLTVEQVRSIDWAEPTWAAGDEIRAGAAAWMIESGEARIVVDPAQAADEILRSAADARVHQEAFAALLAAAGFPRETITHAIATHLEGIGMFAWRNDDGTWSPFFPNAPLLMCNRELDAADRGTHPSGSNAPFDELRAAGVVQPTADNERINDEVTLELTGGHTPGHQIVRVSSGDQTALVLGHLAVAPLHLVTGECPQEHPDPVRALAAMLALRDEDAVLIGPLWPAPGAARWDGSRLIPVGPA